MKVVQKDESLRPSDFTPAFGVAFNVQAKAWTYLRSNGKGFSARTIWVRGGAAVSDSIGLHP